LSLFSDGYDRVLKNTKNLEETKKLSGELFKPRSKEFLEAFDETILEGSPQNLVNPGNKG